MNIFDLIIYLVLALALWEGWRHGVILQVCSLVGLVAGIWLAGHYGVSVGEMLGLKAPVSQGCGFVIVLIVTIVALALVGRILRKLFQFAGFGVPDIVLGVVVAVAKYLLLLGVLFSAFERINVGHSMVEKSTINDSRWYRPVVELSDRVLPFLDWVGEQIPEENKLWNEPSKES